MRPGLEHARSCGRHDRAAGGTVPRVPAARETRGGRAPAQWTSSTSHTAGPPLTSASRPDQAAKAAPARPVARAGRRRRRGARRRRRHAATPERRSSASAPPALSNSCTTVSNGEHNRAAPAPPGRRACRVGARRRLGEHPPLADTGGATMRPGAVRPTQRRQPLELGGRGRASVLASAAARAPASARVRPPACTPRIGSALPFSSTGGTVRVVNLRHRERGHLTGDDAPGLRRRLQSRGDVHRVARHRPAIGGRLADDPSPVFTPHEGAASGRDRASRSAARRRR